MPIEIEGKEYTEQELVTLQKAGLLQIGQKNDLASTTVSVSGFHGAGQSGTGVDSTLQFGLFSDGQSRPDRISNVPRIRRGLFGSLPAFRSVYLNERQDVLTGQTADGNSNAAGFNDADPPKPGLLKIASQNFTWGSHYASTDTTSLPLVGQRRHYGDVPGIILNQGPNMNPYLPDILFNMSPTSELSKSLFQFGIAMERTADLVAIRGQAATDNSRWGWFLEFAGLDGQIATGKTDSVTSIAVPSLDSDVQAFSAIVTGSDSNGRSIVEAVTDQYYALNDRAMLANIGDVTFALVMRKELFRVLVDNWTENYATYRITGAAGTPFPMPSMEAQNMRLAMQQGRFLWIEGDRVPVILTEGIDAGRADTNDYTQDMYMIPLSVNGIPLSYFEYFPMDNPAITEFIQFSGFNDFRIINNGMYIVGRNTTGLGIEYLVGSRWRLILRAPWLCGRVDDISFTYLANTRVADPGTTYWHADGGVTYRA